MVALFFRRKQGLIKGKGGQRPLADHSEMTTHDLPGGCDGIEPRPEPDPSARDEFHQEYTKQIQAADKDAEDLSRTLESVSYPVSKTFPEKNNLSLRSVPCSR